jgi:hypothetical protein
MPTSILAAALTATVLGGAALPLGGDDDGRELEYDDARMIIEFNDTDQDVGIQVFLDGEPWKQVRIYDPLKRKILEIRATRSLRLQGLSELFFESSEPSLKDLSLEDFLRRFPEGIYEFEGITIEGEEIEAEALFTHVMPEGPVILSPREDSIQDPDDTVVSWLPVPDPPDGVIDAYQVIVTQELDVLPKRTFSVHVPASVTSVTVPAEFMQPDADYEFEVLAIEAGGNQTIAASFFSTSD